MVMNIRSLATLLLVSTVAGAAFVPANKMTSSATTTALKFGFLKDLGLEKPSWLPDFGGKKKEEEGNSEPVAEETPAEGEEVAAAAPAEE
jgi:hypothetical protein